MHLLKTLAIASSLAIPLPALAQIDCSSIQTIETMHGAQLRQMPMPLPRVPSSDMQTIIVGFQAPQSAAATAAMPLALPEISCHTTALEVTTKKIDPAMQAIPILGPSATGSILAPAPVLLSLAVIMIASLALLGRFALRWYSIRKMRRRRSGTRYPTNFATDIRIGGTRISVRVLDLSCRGAKMRYSADLDPAPNQDVKIFLNEEWQPARLSWTNQSHFGITFANALSPAYVQDASTLTPFHTRTGTDQQESDTKKTALH